MMVEVRTMFNVNDLTSLFLGQQGENLATEIRIDMSPWLEDNADLTIYMVAIRHSDATAYVPATTMDEKVLVWPITSYDTAIVGTGLCQIVASDGTRIVKAKRIRTAVGTVIPGTDEDTAPEPIGGWIDNMIAQVVTLANAVLETKDAAETAAESAITARTGAVDANTSALAAADAAAASETAADASATSAATSATSAETSASQAAAVLAHAVPKIDPETTTWQLWDSTQEEYMDTGVPANGRPGAKGDTGPQGPQGETGATGPIASITSQTMVYQNSTAGDTIPSGEWQSVRPVTPQGQYLWTRLTLSWNNGIDTVLYSVSRMGVDGTGSVVSVNDKGPDQDGDVSLSGADIPVSGTDSTKLNTAIQTLATGLSQKANSDDLATVATSGDYADLTGAPNLSTVATSGAYSDLSGKPALADVATSGEYSDLSGTPNLATVATSGAYSDLSGTPSLATVATSGRYADLQGKPALATIDANGLMSSGDKTVVERVKYVNSNLAVVANGSTAPSAITAGQYVIWQGVLYTANNNIASGATITTADVTAVSGGGLNKLNESISSLNSKLTIKTETKTVTTNANGNAALYTNYDRIPVCARCTSADVVVQIVYVTSRVIWCKLFNWDGTIATAGQYTVEYKYFTLP